MIMTLNAWIYFNRINGFILDYGYAFNIEMKGSKF